MNRYSLRNTFDQFWERHLRAVHDVDGSEPAAAASPSEHAVARV
jgi:hypothetical protein